MVLMEENKINIFYESLEKSLSVEKAELLFNHIMSGDFSDIKLSAILSTIRSRGETVDEIIGATKAMRKHSKKIISDDNTIDIVGTGGDGKGTLNISTAVSFVLAGTDIPIAKHGNYSATSKSGAANVLKSLSVNIDCEIDIVERCLDEIGICFLLAPKHHIAMKYVGKIRQEIGIRTIFNLLGPLSNPALVKRQLLGVYDKSLILPFAESLKTLGSTHAWIVHGSDGLDEVTITGETYCAELKNGNIREFSINPSDIDIPTAKIADIVGGEPQENAKEIIELFNGKKSKFRDVIILNSASALVATGNAQNLQEGALKSIESLDNGKAMEKLEMLIEMTNL